MSCFGRDLILSHNLNSEIVIPKNICLIFHPIPMLKHLGKWAPNSITLFPHPTTFLRTQPHISPFPLKIRIKRAYGTPYRATRRVRYDEEDEDYGYNEELAMLESYTQLAKDEILFVQATVDEEQVEVLIFKVYH